jgi:hypothetical protein
MPQGFIQIIGDNGTPIPVLYISYHPAFYLKKKKKRVSDSPSLSFGHQQQYQ